MIRIQHAISIAFPLALAGLVNCSSDSNDIIGAPNTRGGAANAGAPAVAGSSGAVPTAGAPAQGGAATQAGAGGAIVTAGGSPDAGGSSGGGGSPGVAGAPIVAGAASICTPASGQFDCNNVLSGMDGYANQDVPEGPSSGPDAIEPKTCVPDETNPKIWKEQHWQLKGNGIEPAKSYKVDLHVYGVVECKRYNLPPNPMGPALNDSSQKSVTLNHNLWMPGATEPSKDHWNTYAFTVTPESNSQYLGIGAQDKAPTAANSYVINQCPGNQGEDHYTWRLDFTASIVVPGNSWVNYIEYDTNCRLIANCGAANAGQSCNGPYNVVDAVKSAVPATNANFTQPPVNANSSRGQWWLVDVTGISAM